MRNTSQIGEVSRTQVMAALARSGQRVLVPLADYQRYDLVIDEGGRFLRVQVKTGRLHNGAVVFNPCSIDSRSKAGGCVRKGYADQIEFFGVYCPETNKCYLVPVGDAPTNTCSLRIDPPQNGQKALIRWAGPYEIGEGVELAGFEPATS
ncbi:MAG TPA: group I intron-associated PD-(D/E)XK endonuclease [Gemmataceae bacterium]|nr:group I intron-associated PD-(D/E)XK endonuclease [Gemmataceae bacterium]